MDYSGCITHYKYSGKDLNKDWKFCMFQFLGEQLESWSICAPPSRTSLFIKIILKWKAEINLILSQQAVDSDVTKRRQDTRDIPYRATAFNMKHIWDLSVNSFPCAGCASFVLLDHFTEDFCHRLSAGWILSVPTFLHSQSYQYPFLGTLSPSLEVFGDGLGRDGSLLSV